MPATSSRAALMYTTYKGAAAGEFMEAIGFDAMALGNHEFDDGPEGFIRFCRQSTFPVVSGNLDVSQNDALDAEVEDTIDPRRERRSGRHRLGAGHGHGRNLQPRIHVIFQDEIDAIQNDVDALTEQGVDIIIALTHVGLPADIRIAEAVTGLDVIVGGHSHTYLSATTRTGRGLSHLDHQPRWRPWCRSCRPMPIRNTSAISK
jgi:5'-nucleotidase/UDP-sugar diphosphatase